MIRALVLAACLPGAALALTDADCQGQRDLLLGGAGLSLSAGPGQAEGDWCIVPNVAWGDDGIYGPITRAEVLRYRLTGDPALPLTVEAQVTGLRMGVSIPDDTLLEWLLLRQSGPEGIAIDMALSRDAAAQTLTLDRLAVDFPGPNALSLTVALGDVDLPALAADPAQMMTATLRNLRAEVTTDGLFEAYALVPIGQAVLAGSTDPDADLAALQGRMRALVAALPASLIDAPSRAAATALIDDLPHPRGTVLAEVSAPAGLGVVPFIDAQNDPGAWLSLLEGVTLRLTYTPITPDP